MIEPGTKLGTFEISGMLGKGGMGEVYRATDSKLGRDVAIKVLPESFSSDPERMGRFEREAQTLASLNHSNVATIHGFEHDTSTGSHYLVMEYIDGETLTERIESRSLSIPEILETFIQFARGLDAAHEVGIIHRDLKPDNVKVASDGTVKVIDFGIAKSSGLSGSVAPDAATTPMSPVAITAEGTFMGTPVYMSPEQARGQTVDKRTDLWSFGCCLFEALTHSLPFVGDTVADTVGNILKTDPDWSAIPSNTPNELTRVVRRCLEKDVRRRLSSAADCAIALEDLLTDIREGRATTSKPDSGNHPLPESDPSAIRAIAVLPFENLMGDKEQQYLVDGMTDALTSELSKIKEIKVISRSSAVRYRKTDKTAPEIAAELGVDGLVQGSIFRAGEDIRISAQLVDARVDQQVWSDNFTGSFDDMLKLQNDVTFAIVKEMKVTLTPEQKKRIRKRRTTTREVEKTLWEASYEFNRHSAEGYKRAIALYKRAIEMDPNFPTSYVGLCAAYWVPAILGGIRSRDALEAAQVAAEKAIALDEDLSGGHMSMGYVKMALHHDWDGARISFERAIELHPSDSEAHSGLALLNLALTDWEDAEREIMRARELDPLSIMYMNNHGLICVQKVKPEDAIRHLEEAVAINPMFVIARQNLSIAYHAAGRTQEAITNLETSDSSLLNLPLTQAWLAHLYREAGDAKKAKTIVREHFGGAAGRYTPPLASAVAYSVVWDSNSAEKKVAESMEDREWTILFIANPWFPRTIDFGDRYGEVLKKLRLPERVVTKALAREQSRRIATDAPLRSASKSFGWKVAAAVGAVGIVLGVLFGLWMGSGSGDGVNESASAQITSLAVLPLENLMNDPEQDYFVDGMTEAITAELSQISSLKVISRTSAMHYKASTSTAPEIAKELGVAGLIEGSVMRQGNNVNIRVSLVDGSGDGQLWTNTYDGTLDNIFQLNSDIALAITDEIRAELTPDERRRVSESISVSAAAFEKWLRAREHMREQTKSGYETAVDLLTEVIQMEPTFADAHAGLAVTYFNAELRGLLATAENAERAEMARARALELDPDSAYVNTMAARSGTLSIAEAQRFLHRAVELNPNEFDAHRLLAHSYAGLGQLQEGLREAKRSIESDPLNILALDTHADVYSFVGDREAAAAIRLKNLEQFPGHPGTIYELITDYVALGEYNKAEALLNQIVVADTHIQHPHSTNGATG